jgi:hypothetical protein
VGARNLDKCHEIRNLAEYEGDSRISERLTADLIGACGKVESALGQLLPLNARD